MQPLSAMGESGDTMIDNELVENTARGCLDRHGSTAIERLCERAEVAAGIGDILSAEAWQDIADAAQRLAYPRSTAK
jgi:hypothetical protein